MGELIKVNRRSGQEHFHNKGKILSAKLINFWQWADSDLLSNALRGRLAEYLVALDIGITDGVRTEWIASDLKTKDGITIEVKSAAYIQSWRQKRPSVISFDIKPSLGWDPDTSEFGAEKKRHSDVYVFALLREQNKNNIDPLDISQWKFFVLSAKVLDGRLGAQKSIRLSALIRLEPEEVSFGNIKKAVKKASKQK